MGPFLRVRFNGWRCGLQEYIDIKQPNTEIGKNNHLWMGPVCELILFSGRCLNFEIALVQLYPRGNYA